MSGSIEGKWVGTGYGFQIVNGIEIKHKNVEIELDIRKEMEDIYLVLEFYRKFEGTINFLQNSFVFARIGNQFYCEDSSGFGVNHFSFASSTNDPNKLDRLTYKYSVANEPGYGNVAFVYKLKRSNC